MLHQHGQTHHVAYTKTSQTNKYHQNKSLQPSIPNTITNNHPRTGTINNTNNGSILVEASIELMLVKKVMTPIDDAIGRGEWAHHGITF